MAKKAKPEGKKYNYMDTYGDLVTLLLCFFVLLFSMSTVEQSKYNAFVDALSNRFGPAPLNMSSVTSPDAPPGNDFGEDEPTVGDTLDPVAQLPAEMNQLYENINEYIEEHDMQGDVKIEVGESGAVFIRLTDKLLFSGDSSVLRSEAMDFLTFIGSGFKEVEDQILQINIMGHTGFVEGSGTDDWMLSGERASRVASYLYRTVGMTPFKLHTLGYGRFYPIGDNATAEGLAANRRVDLVVVGNNAENIVAALAEAQRVYFPDDDTKYFEGSPDELPSAQLDAAFDEIRNYQETISGEAKTNE